MINTDFHLHTIVSVDAYDGYSDIILSAIDKNLTEIAITEHVDYNPADEGAGLYNPQEVYNLTQKYSQKYADKITIHYGVELSEPHLYAEENKLIYSLKPDIVIGSLHYVGKLGVHSDLFDRLHHTQAINDYFDEMINMTESADFDVLGHLDYFVRYTAIRNIPNYNPLDFEKKIRKVLNTIIKREIALEVNTSGLRSKANTALPHPQVIEWYYQMQGKLLSIASDAHRAQDVAKDFDKVEKLLKNIGFTEYHIYRNRNPVSIPL